MRLPTLLLSDQEDLGALASSPGAFAQVLCLFWAAPSTKSDIATLYRTTVGDLSDLFDNFGALEVRAVDRLNRFLRVRADAWGDSASHLLGEGLYRTSLLTVTIESVLHDLDSVENAVNLTVSSDICELVRHRANCVGVDIEISSLGPSTPSTRPGRLAKAVFHLKRFAAEARISNNWNLKLQDLVDSLDKDFAVRSSLRRWRPRARASAGSICFFSSYLNNTRSLLPFENCMPGKVEWVVANHFSRAPIRGTPSPTHWLWEFMPEGDSRARNSSATSPGVTQRSHPGSSLDDDDLSRDPNWQWWRTRGHRLIRIYTACWERYLREHRPRLVVLASQWGLEGWFIELAKQRGIPVLQVMHGILGGRFYLENEILSDTMVVSGEFWRDLWSESARRKITVFNPSSGFPTVERVEHDGLPTLTFFSWPLTNVLFYSESELQRGLIELLSRLVHQGGVRVRVRLHPLEDPTRLLSLWRHLDREALQQTEVEKGTPLSQTLATTDCALMYRSTLMLDCVVNGIPAVIPAWTGWWDWKGHLGNSGGLTLANDFLDLESKIRQCLERAHVPRSRHGAPRLVRRPGEGESAFRHLVAELLQP